jgi:hypothetical protein
MPTGNCPWSACSSATRCRECNPLPGQARFTRHLATNLPRQLMWAMMHDTDASNCLWIPAGPCPAMTTMYETTPTPAGHCLWGGGCWISHDDLVSSLSSPTLGPDNTHRCGPLRMGCWIPTGPPLDSTHACEPPLAGGNPTPALMTTWVVVIVLLCYSPCTQRSPQSRVFSDAGAIDR